MIDEAREQGFVTTILGRRRYIPEINSPDMRMRQFAERTAVNTPIQGSAADIIKVAMIAIRKSSRKSACETKMTLQVHDELVFDVPKDELEAAYKIVKDGMEKVIKLKVPVEAHIEVGKNWLERSDSSRDEVMKVLVRIERGGAVREDGRPGRCRRQPSARAWRSRALTCGHHAEIPVR